MTTTPTRPEPGVEGQRGEAAVRWLLYAAGTGMAGYGLQGVVRDPGSDVVRWAAWLLGGALAHDLLLVPLVLLVGRALPLLPGRLRTPVQAALLVGAVLTLVSVPVLGRFGVKAGQPLAPPARLHGRPAGGPGRGRGRNRRRRCRRPPPRPCCQGPQLTGTGLRGAAAGVLAGALGLTVGELLGRTVPGGHSPVLAVADRVVDLTPDGLRRWAISSVGTSDKPLLLTGVLVVCVLLAAVGGAQARQRPGLTGILLGTLAGVSLLAQLPEPDARPAGATAVAAGLALAVALALRLLVSVTPREPLRGPAVTERRAFLVRSAWTAGAVLVGGGLLRHLVVAARVDALRAAVGLPVPVRHAPGDLVAADLGVPGVSPVLTPNAAFYRIDTALLVPQVDPSTWSLSVDGLVDTPYRLTYAELMAMPQVEADITIQCVSNEVGGDLVGTARWQGVLLRDLLARAGVQRTAEQVLGTSTDGFTAGFPVVFAGNGSPAMVAVAMNGEPLPLEHGFPARLLVPGLYGYVSATKWLRRLTLTRRDVDGYWIPRGWSKDGPIKTASRIEVPRDHTLLPAGRTAVAGTAWAPGRGRGVVAVQVRVDGGPWQQADLGGALSEDTWRQWRWAWDAAPGDHVLEVRATDRLGDVQTGEVADVLPDGASGYHQVLVRVQAGV